jgi:hypothetical protein
LFYLRKYLSTFQFFLYNHNYCLKFLMSLLLTSEQMTIYDELFLVIGGTIGNGINILVFSTFWNYRATPCTFYFLIAFLQQYQIGTSSRIHFHHCAVSSWSSCSYILWYFTDHHGMCKHQCKLCQIWSHISTWSYLCNASVNNGDVLHI